MRSTLLASLNVRFKHSKFFVCFFVDFYLIEEFFNAAIVLNNREWADFFLDTTAKNFPRTPKTMRMLAMFYES